MTGVKLSIVWSSGGSTSSQPHSFCRTLYLFCCHTKQWLVIERGQCPKCGPIFGSKKQKKLCTWLLIFNGQSCRRMKCFCFYFKYLYLVLRICISYQNLQYFIVELHSDLVTTRTRDNERSNIGSNQVCSLHWDWDCPQWNHRSWARVWCEEYW